MWDELRQKDLIGRLNPLLRNRSLYLDKDTGKITKAQVLATDAPWIFISKPSWLDCDLWHNVFFNCLGIIHSKCFECYKVVVRPRTLKELFSVYDLMVDLGIPSKAGVEQRKYVQELYGCYFYCNGLEDGKRVYKIVRDMVNKVSPEIGVILKRGCTEFELRHGDSSKYEQKPEDAHWEKLVDEHFDLSSEHVTQPDFLKDHIKLRWIAHAYQSGDKTYMEYTGGKDIFSRPTTYHEGAE